MLKEIRWLIALCCFFLSCNNSNSVSANKILKKNYEKIYRQYGYSDTGFNRMTTLFVKSSDQDISSTLYYYNYASHYYINRQDYHSASQYADSMLLIVNQPAQQNSLQKERAIANINKADALYYMKRFKDCYYYYCNGILEANEAKDSAIFEDLNRHLSMFMFEEGNYAKAIFYYQQLLAFSTAGNDKYEQLINNQGTLDNIGISFLKEKKWDSAIVYFNEAIQNIEQASLIKKDKQNFCRLALGVVYGNLGQAYVLAHRYNQAETLYKKSISINIQPSFANENALITQQHLAELYYEQNKLAPFYQTLQNIKSGLDTIANNNVIIQWNYLMNQYYAAIHKPDSALVYLKTYLQLKEENSKNTNTVSESNLFDQMQLMQSKYSMNLLKKDNVNKAAYLFIACSLFILVLTIALLLFIHSKKTKKNVHELTFLNNEIQQKQTLLNETLADLEKQNIEKQHILQVVAHDLRNPLSAIHTLAGVVLNEYECEEDNREYLELIRSACMESNQLINSILEIAENTDVKYNYEPVDVNVLLANSTQLLSMKASEKNQRIELITSPQQGMIYADIEKMNRVVGNLLTNAIKFSSSGSYIEVSAFIFEHHVMISIKDNGIGIPEQYHDKIFNAFTDAKRAGTEGEKTFGLGLSITKQIVEKHHGRIWFESAENKGTTFFIQFSRMEDALTPSEEKYRDLTSVKGS